MISRRTPGTAAAVYLQTLPVSKPTSVKAHIPHICKL